MLFVFTVLVSLALFLTCGYFWPDNNDRAVTIWLSTMAWWLSFLYLRNWIVGSVRIRVLDSGTNMEQRNQRFDALPEYAVMLYSPRFFHMWTHAQWSRWLSKKGVLTVEDQEGIAVAHVKDGKWTNIK